MPISISKACSEDAHLWDEFCLEENVHHHSYSIKWSYIIESVFKHSPNYLIAKETLAKETTQQNDSSSETSETKVVGVAPSFFVNSLLFGSSIISVPYLNGGGIISNDPEAKKLLLEKLISATKNNKNKYLELRNRHQDLELPNDLPCRSHKIAMVLELEKSIEAQFQKFPAKLRSQIRKPEKNGVSCEVFCGSEFVETLAGVKATANDYGNIHRGNIQSRSSKVTPEQALKDFYRVFSTNMRDLGTPCYPQKLFIETLKNFQKSAKLFVCYLQDDSLDNSQEEPQDNRKNSSKKIPIACALTIGFGNTTEIIWASSLRKYNHLSANMLLYWKAISQSILDEYKFFDFGRSSLNSSTFNFKKQWLATPQTLYWYYYSPQNFIPDVNPNSKKFHLLTQIWQKLPLPLANFMGSYLTKSLP